MPKVAFTCKYCGHSAECWPSQKRSYCSQTCRSKHRAETGMPTKPTTGEWVPCESCQEPLWRMQHQVRSGEGRFCSKKCYDTWQARNRVPGICEQCGSEFQVSPSQARFLSMRWCSRACESRARMRRPLDREHNGKPAVLDGQGYVRIYEPGHPRAAKGGWIFEHRWVVEQALGRHLRRDEHVHHINHVRSDNRIENLEVLSHGEHSRITGNENREALQAALEARQRLAEYERLYGPLEATGEVK